MSNPKEVLVAKNILTGVVCSLVSFSIIGIVTHYADKAWIEDKNEPEGGTYQSVKKRFDEPRVEIEFTAEVNVVLETGTTYQDNMGNFFDAIANRVITNANRYVKKFSIPTILIPISKPFKEGQ